MPAKLRKGDEVVILAGKDKGKVGTILSVLPDDCKVLVQGVNVIKKHVKPSAKSAGGIVAQESPIHISNVALKDPKSGKPTRVGMKKLADGRMVRVAKKSGEQLTSAAPKAGKK